MIPSQEQPYLAKRANRFLAGGATLALFGLVYRFGISQTRAPPNRPSTSSWEQDGPFAHPNDRQGPPLSLKMSTPSGGRLHPDLHPITGGQQTWRSQEGQDAYMQANFFEGLYGGTYIEAGAWDGLTFSNTAHYETNMGWRGLMVEMAPESYDKLIKNRPNDININTAICNEAKQLRLVSDVEGENVGRNVVYEFLSEDYRRQYYSHLRTEDDLERATRGWLSCIPVRDLLSLLRLRHIDMFSLDVEGAELDVLHSINWERVTIDVFCIEVFLSDPDKVRKQAAFLESKGYEQWTRDLTPAQWRKYPHVSNPHVIDQYWVRRAFVPTALERQQAAFGSP